MRIETSSFSTLSSVVRPFEQGRSFSFRPFTRPKCEIQGATGIQYPIVTHFHRVLSISLYRYNQKLLRVYRHHFFSIYDIHPIHCFFFLRSYFAYSFNLRRCHAICFLCCSSPHSPIDFSLIRSSFLYVRSSYNLPRLVVSILNLIQVRIQLAA